MTVAKLLKWFGPTVLVLLAAALQYFLSPLVGYRAFLLLFPAIFLGCLIGNFLSGLVATVIADAIAWFLFLPAVSPFTNYGNSDYFGLLVFTFTSILLFAISGRIRLSRAKELEACKRAEEANEKLTSVNLELARLASIVTSSADALISKKLNGEITTWNPGAERLFGYTALEMIGKSITLIVPPELLTTEHQIFEDVCSGAASPYHETKRIHKDGRLIDVSLTISVVRNSEGVICGGTCSMRDISDRRRSQDALRSAHEKLSLTAEHLEKEKSRLEAFLDLNVDGWWDWNLLDREDVFVSSGFKKLMGYGEHELPNKKSVIDTLVHPDDLAEAMANVANHLKTDGTKPFYQQLRFRHKSGKTLWVILRGKPLRDNEGNFVRMMGTHTDITHLKETQFNLERSNSELEQFAGIAAHDLRSPLKAIHRWADMLNFSIPEPRSAVVDEGLRFIKLSTEKADTLVRDVLDIVRLNNGARGASVVDLNQLVKGELSSLNEEILRAGARVTCNELPIVEGNPSHLETLFGNLLRNALVYRNESKGPEISIGYREKWNTFEFYVEDNGIGIEPNYSNRIFEMFTRLHNDEKYPGTGIGLALCKKVVEFRGGRIWVRSRPGEGSTFYFTYPKRAEEFGANAVPANNVG